MSTKTIAIMDDVYKLLKSLQRPGESFSIEIRRLATDNGKISQFAGAWKTIGEKEAKDMFQAIKNAREMTKKSIKRKVGL